MPPRTEHDLTERVVDRQVLHRGAFLEFRIDTVERADGTRAVRDIAGHPGAVAVVAVDADDRVALVRQWRLPADAALLEIPAGGLDVHDGVKEDPDLAAPRELEEETGLRAASWQKLGTFYTAPGFTDELMHLYLATDLSPAHPGERLGPDEDERLIVEWRPWRDAVAAAERGEIRDAKSLVGLFWLARLRGGVEAVVSTDAPGVDVGGPITDDAGPDVAVARYRLTMLEILRANMSVMQRSTGTLLFGGAMLLVGVWSTATMGDLGIGLLVNAPFLVLGTLFVTGLFAVPIAWWQARKRPDLLEAPTTVRVDPSGLTVESGTVRGHHAWGTFRRVHDHDGFFFLDTGSGSNVIVPKRAFAPTDLATVYRLLDRQGLLKGRRS